LRLANLLQAMTLPGLLWALSACGPGTADLGEASDELATEEASLASYPGLTEGAPEALGVLRVANESSLATLSSSNGAGIPSRTAKSVVAVRSGPDGQEPTADDRPFATLKQLFAVRYVGKVTVDRLLAYAKAHGYVKLDDPMPSCPGQGRMPAAELFFRSGQESYFTRTCGSFGACSPWKVERPAKTIWFFNGPNSLYMTPSGGVYVRAGLSTSSSTSGSSTYVCQYYDIGEGNVDPATGVGTGTMQSGFRCNILGGSGGPYGSDPSRRVDLQWGATCLSLIDQDGAAPHAGVEHKRIITLVP
jgi:hypothetical protein